MATYAAFRHVELDKVGYGKKRVLKPPGGGSSDIFGATETDAPTPRRVKNHQQSSVFGALASEEANGTPVQARNNSGNNTYDRLFGGSAKEQRPQSAKTSLKSNIVSSTPDASPEDPAAVNNTTPTKVYALRNPVTGDGMDSSDMRVRRSSRGRGGNPVTGEGYNGTEEKEHSPQPLQPQQLPLRSRVPPGGYSSQLW